MECKEIYINSRLRPLPVGVRALRPLPEEWIFSQGCKWLRLTPPRLRRLAARLGLDDNRVSRLLSVVRRWHPHPEDFCRAVGEPPRPQLLPRDYPAALCPRCGRVHNPHPEEAGAPCPVCAGAGDTRPLRRVAERKADEIFRERLRRKAPDAFDNGVLSPNWRINKHRRLERDWDAAVNRILLGWHYRDVAVDFKCSVGILHRKVAEAKYWEWN